VPKRVPNKIPTTTSDGQCAPARTRSIPTATAAPDPSASSARQPGVGGAVQASAASSAKGPPTWELGNDWCPFLPNRFSPGRPPLRERLDRLLPGAGQRRGERDGQGRAPGRSEGERRRETFQADDRRQAELRHRRRCLARRVRTGPSGERGFEVPGAHVHGNMLAIARESDKLSGG